MGADRGQRGGRLAGEQATKDLDVAEVAGRTSLAERLGRGEGLTHGRKVARKLEGACLADMGQGEAWVSSDGAVESRGGAGIDGQQEVDTFDVSISRGGGGGGNGETVAVRQHGGPPGGAVSIGCG